MIEISNISKVFSVHEKEPGLKGSLKSLFRRKWKEKNALKDVSLKVEAGEVLGLVGANGAGKTTLVKILSGIIAPSGGEVSVLGFNPWDRENEFRSQISLIMGQKAQLWWDLPAADCFLLLREIYQIPKGEFSARLQELTQTLGVQDQLKIQIRRLSLGERMKMELIAALLHRPRVIFLDEPTIGLDFTAQKAIRRFLLEYRKKYQPAMLITSHYMDDIEELCPRIAILREGQLVYDGGLQQIINEHARHKVITAQLKEDIVCPFNPPEGLQAEVISCESSELKVKALRGDAPHVVAQILAQLPVLDLEVQEEDISNIIESIMRRR